MLRPSFASTCCSRFSPRAAPIQDVGASHCGHLVDADSTERAYGCTGSCFARAPARPDSCPSMYRKADVLGCSTAGYRRSAESAFRVGPFACSSAPTPHHEPVVFASRRMRARSRLAHRAHRATASTRRDLADPRAPRSAPERTILQRHGSAASRTFEDCSGTRRTREGIYRRGPRPRPIRASLSASSPARRREPFRLQPCRAPRFPPAAPRR